MTTTAQVLRDAKALIADPDHWIKGLSWNLVEGRDCYCMAGAVNQSLDRPYDYSEVHTNALIALQRATGVTHIEDVPDFNDDPATTHADVMAAFDRAIAAEESS